MDFYFNRACYNKKNDMILNISSKAYGVLSIEIEDTDYELVKQYKWSFIKSKSGKFYAQHTWKRGGLSGRISMHRLIMNITDPKIYVDHRDGNPLNNKRSNLRIATPSQNSMNRGKTIENKSGYKGVLYEPKKKLYRVIIAHNKKVIRGGRFKDPKMAALKYNELAKQYHGEFAYQNKI